MLYMSPWTFVLHVSLLVRHERADAIPDERHVTNSVRLPPNVSAQRKAPTSLRLHYVNAM
jgi:hypothetical protein